MKVRSKLVGWISTLIVIMAMGAPAHGEEKYSVSGTVSFSEGEVVFISLYTQDRFNDFKNRSLPPEPYTQVIELSAEQRKAGKAEFLFKGIPRGDLWGGRIQGDQEDHEKRPEPIFQGPCFVLQNDLFLRKLE